MSSTVTEPHTYDSNDPSHDRVNWLKSIPFFIAHLTPLLAFFTPFKWEYVLLCVFTYYLRMFFITAGYHRYFSHRAYQTSRWFQFFLAFMAESSAQKGALWWASHHRHHHRESDMPGDIHSPTLRGFWWSQVGWILCSKYDEPRWEQIKDFSRFPELVFINKHYWIPPLVGSAVLYAIGGWGYLLWGGLISTVILWHGTFTINSLSHVFGKRRYLTTDTSRNNFFLALITCGEGWHNNHHYHQNTANQGWFWWEVDLSYYVLRLFKAVGLVWKLKVPEDQTRYVHLKYTDAQRQQLKLQSVFGKGIIPEQPVAEPAAPLLPLAAPAPAALIKRS
jgi:stearoyl-CoA desaturase (delta-9 desaturase)